MMPQDTFEVALTRNDAQVLLTALGLYDSKLEAVAKRMTEVGAPPSTVVELRGTVETLRNTLFGQYELSFGPAQQSDEPLTFGDAGPYYDGES